MGDTPQVLATSDRHAIVEFNGGNGCVIDVEGNRPIAIVNLGTIHSVTLALSPDGRFLAGEVAEQTGTGFTNKLVTMRLPSR